MFHGGFMLCNVFVNQLVCIVLWNVSLRNENRMSFSQKPMIIRWLCARDTLVSLSLHACSVNAKECESYEAANDK